MRNKKGDISRLECIEEKYAIKENLLGIKEKDN